MFAPIILIYLGRIAVDQFFEYERGPYGLGWLIICPIPCGAIVLVAALIIVLAVHIVRRTKQITLALVIGVEVIAALLIPLPPLPRPVFPEETFFAAHRTEFEEVVNLARQDSLECGDRGCEYAPRILPDEYNHLSERGRIYVYREIQLDNFFVEFNPFTFYYPIIYFQTPDDVNLPQHSICQLGRWVRQLDEHWWLCVEEWN
jgi:hypothetical protein